ncbi:MAG TPA: chorismate lyase [Methanobacteriaceae archaeon]|nr:chorismate lyase [Methanobacteriaceae archaeon]
MDELIFNGINKIENSLGGLSSAQKILLATDGSVTTILDVLKGKIQIRTLVQEFREADLETAQLLDIDEGDTVNFRIVIIEGKEPLIHATSIVPIKRLNNSFKEDLVRADIPIGRILKKYKIESRREIRSIEIEENSSELEKIFKDEGPFLSRTYHIIYKNQPIIWLKETFPYTMFRE